MGNGRRMDEEMIGRLWTMEATYTSLTMEATYTDMGRNGVMWVDSLQSVCC